ncbi:MAG TPA: hypothetical protein EYH59_03020 [Pyrodictium sp.]|nr:hypothetical protein [Pyrodictium sp.]
MAGVWEKALAEEMVYLLAHLAHAEQHLLEIGAELGDVEPKILVLVDKLRIDRKKVGEVLYNSLGLSELGGEGSEFRSASESLWCTLKHLSMALVHCDESIEKLARRLVEALERGDEASSKKILSDIRELFAVRKTLRDSLKATLFELPESVKGVESIRCREDLCIETEEDGKEASVAEHAVARQG